MLPMPRGAGAAHGKAVSGCTDAKHIDADAKRKCTNSRASASVSSGTDAKRTNTDNKRTNTDNKRSSTDARQRASRVSLAVGDSLDFGVHEVEGAQVRITEEGIRTLSNQLYSADHPTNLVPFTLEGPPDALACLRQLLGAKAELQGCMSPISHTTLAGSNAATISMPRRAVSFGFSYPLSALHGRQAELLEIVGVRFGSRALESPPPWLDFVITGGFCYFDKSNVLLRCNALGAHVASSGTVNLIGPYQALPKAGNWLQSVGRLRPVTLSSLSDAGFHSFGWVFRDEAPGGSSLGEAHEQVCARGVRARCGCARECARCGCARGCAWVRAEGVRAEGVRAVCEGAAGARALHAPVSRPHGMRAGRLCLRP